MSCMTHMISFLCGKSHINGRQKIGTMTPCTTHVISFLYDKSHINSQKNIGTMMPFFLLHPTSVEVAKTFINDLRSSATGNQLRLECVSTPPAAARTRSSRAFRHFQQRTMEPLLALWNSSKVKFFQFGSRCFVHLQHGTHRHHKTTIILQLFPAAHAYQWKHNTWIHYITNEHWHDHYAILEISRTAPTETSRDATHVEDICLSIPGISQTWCHVWHMSFHFIMEMSP